MWPFKARRPSYSESLPGTSLKIVEIGRAGNDVDFAIVDERTIHADAPPVDEPRWEELIRDFKEFEQQALRIGDHRVTGGHLVFRFDNGYGASVIDRPMLEWSEPGIYELAVVEFDADGRWWLTYDTAITSDVERGTADEIREMLRRVAELPAKPPIEDQAPST